MKTKITLAIAIACCLISFGCKEKQETEAPAEPAAVVDLINDDFPEAKKEITATMEAIFESVKDGDIDKLIAFHAYSPKFTEFKGGAPRNGAAENEEFERNTFGAVTEVIKMDTNDMQIAVYGDVANVTFHSDFHLKFGEDLAVVNDQISLLFVKNSDGEWKIVAEHHSPLKMGEEG
ncbi:YybH family protein [Lentiprolixibacter aurantiacus]|uniref:Nuclear transport factor 2 family protein n=1 Tax=Lentiprolixibacter aurantiacus TaxID=2993939 RepID=A0AAE3MLD4_9FLAO|nr:nuclear transport factor 2 family protein [Lentiprolixibacter aurantiacus]MCX2719303.1 nuclear transport factor 2 family protein [Lentiprolixibacter aurantiacus]